MHLMLKLPFPPSVNSLYTNQRGGKNRVKSTRYNNWCKFATQCLNEQKTTFFSGKTIILIGLHKPDNRTRDCQNYVKPITDLLVDFGILQDDSLIQFDSSYWTGQLGSQAQVDVYSAQYDNTSRYLAHTIHNLLLSPLLEQEISTYCNTSSQK